MYPKWPHYTRKMQQIAAWNHGKYGLDIMSWRSRIYVPELYWQQRAWEEAYDSRPEQDKRQRGCNLSLAVKLAKRKLANGMASETHEEEEYFPSFPSKLFHMVENVKYNGIIWWTEVRQYFIFFLV